jgi:hypothetical protein
MGHLIGTFLLFVALLASQALADGRAFPPDNCTNTNPFMAFDGVASGGNTYCINGQNVLSNALPGCSPNQQVVFNGTSFICQDNLLDTPDCGPGQFLTSSGGTLSCTSTSVPTCQANYVLTYNGSAFVCVPKNASIPTCTANQFLTYNGSSFQCAATQTLSVPTCGAGETLTGSGGNLACVVSPPGGSTVEQIGASNSGTGGIGNRSLFSGKKFSDYSALVVTYEIFGAGYAGSTVIPMAAFTVGKDYGFLTLYANLEGTAYGYVIIRQVNNTTFYVAGTNGTPLVTLWGVK